MWESAQVAVHHKLDNLVFVIDANKWQAMGRTSEVIDLEPIEKRFEGFGFNWIRIDGHDFHGLHTAFTNPKRLARVSCAVAEDGLAYSRWEKESPLVIICDTIKGKGVSFFEDKILYHYKNIDVPTYEAALAELT